MEEDLSNSLFLYSLYSIGRWGSVAFVVARGYWRLLFAFRISSLLLFCVLVGYRVGAVVRQTVPVLSQVTSDEVDYPQR